ncbi:probable F420-dependent oxidoreductase, Rv2161c family [Longilinea arvoryzae]|uniref:Probable F420-dependent oxidoreductase, Rv2161c family n=1 Tax=Longilinea arvoryzae TaxID=360412 RepID=A0A0S7BP37_9CHLR|nr:TIGR03619 family F420-dependent LLM class oxidoreductase [Longilinea arvoryzae]GAP15573.1 probable F420-dependent oxidoreductase, Rv2161c family [Longilinea arvoryzae]
MMKFGVVLPSYGAHSGRLATVDTTLAAEGMGFDSVWTTDHIALPKADAERFSPLLESITTLAYLAGLTSRIRLGVSSLVLPQRNPLEVARQMATLDVLSGGRAMLACGVGWSRGEYEALGSDFSNRGRRMDESIRVLRSLWRGSRTVSFQGEYYNFQDIDFAPAPIQPGGPPLWVAGDSPAAARRAFRLADGWHPNHTSPENLASLLQPMRPFIAAGRPFTVCLRLSLSFGDSPDPATPLSGNPAQVAAQIRAYRDAGMNYALIHFLAQSQAERERAMRTLMTRVAPEVD